MNASHFYDQVNDDYLQWSRHLNIHFGYFQWKNISHLFFLEKMLAEMNSQVLDLLQIGDYDDVAVLDVGCGIGTTSIQMSHLLRRATFVGINISPKQIRFGNGLVLKKNLQDRVKLIEADFTQVPRPSASFDAAFAIESACYDRGFEKKGFIIEMARLLKPGGRLVVADGFRKHSRPLPKWLEKLHRQNLHYWSMDELADVGLFVEKMKECGFDEVKIKEISWNVAPSAAHLPRVAVRLFFQNLFSKKDLSVHQKNYPKAICLTLLLGLFRRHFGYYLVQAKRR